MGMVVALVGAALAIGVGRATGAGWLPTVGLSVLLGVGLYLWARDPDKGWGDLGESIMVSVIVAIALMAVQRDADERTRKATERRDQQLRDADVRRERQVREAEAVRQKAAERENLQLSLTLQNDLRGIALADRDMRGFFLAGKNFAGADLHGANLAGADLRGSDLQRANLLGANLDKARMAEADLRGAVLSPNDLEFAVRSTSMPPATLREAELQKADLRGTRLGGVNFAGAHLTGAVLRDSSVASPRTTIFKDALLLYADFRGANLSGADLREATLDGAQFCGAFGLANLKLRGARTGSTTRWPRGYEPMDHGAEQSVDLLRSFSRLLNDGDELSDRDIEAILDQATVDQAVRRAGVRVFPPYPACKRHLLRKTRTRQTVLSTIEK